MWNFQCTIFSQGNEYKRGNWERTTHKSQVKIVHRLDYKPKILRTISSVLEKSKQRKTKETKKMKQKKKKQWTDNTVAASSIEWMKKWAKWYYIRTGKELSKAFNNAIHATGEMWEHTKATPAAAAAAATAVATEAFSNQSFHRINNYDARKCYRITFS